MEWKRGDWKEWAFQKVRAIRANVHSAKGIIRGREKQDELQAERA